MEDTLNRNCKLCFIMKSMYRKTKDMQDKKTSCGILPVNSKNYAAVNKHKKMIC